jgi:hypothetical protein
MINKLNELSDLVTRIDAKVLEISTKLDELIKALHEYDDDQLEWPEPNDALLKAAGLYNEELNKKYGESSFEAFQDETELNKRMDIIGQNGNEGSHYVTNEEADENARHNTQTKHVGKKKRNTGKKSAIVEHEKYRSPHKH